MELPNYRMPGMKNVAHLLWDKTKDFLQRAFTVIFVASIVIWFLQSFDFRFNMADGEGSMLAFCLLYTPCVAAIAAVKRELGGKLAVWMVIFQCLVAWLVALLAYQVAGLIIG